MAWPKYGISTSSRSPPWAATRPLSLEELSQGKLPLEKKDNELDHCKKLLNDKDQDLTNCKCELQDKEKELDSLRRNLDSLRSKSKRKIKN